MLKNCSILLLLALCVQVWGQQGLKRLEHEALSLFKAHCLASGFSEEDIRETVISDSHFDTQTNLTHIYFQQFFQQIPVREGVASIHFNAMDRPVHIPNKFVPITQLKVDAETPRLGAKDAINLAAAALDLPPIGMLKEVAYPVNSILHASFFNGEAMEGSILARLIYKRVQDSLQLCWEIGLRHQETDDYWQVWINTQDGKVVQQYKRTLTCHKHENFDFEFVEKCLAEKPEVSKDLPERHFVESPLSFMGLYRVFAPPIASPLFGGRTPETGLSLINMNASPYGWHDTDGNASTAEYEFTRGNNVYAYYDPTGLGSDPVPVAITRLNGNYLAGNVPWPDDFLEFDYENSFDHLTGTPFLEDAITNVFVWTNHCHDVFYEYGFDEVAGNFQQNNYGNGGQENDYLQAEVQDGGGQNNANFDTPPDGGKPRMQLYLWNTDLPNKILDGSFDNAIVVHEFGHGVSFRLVGGPSNSTCLTNYEQGGEGWSDFFGLMLTMQDFNLDGMISEFGLGEGIRSIGTYVIAESADGQGIRPSYYTTNMNCTSNYCNDYTYADLTDLAYPHGIGFLWCTMLWDMTIALMNKHGFESNISTTSSTAGNIRAMKIVMNALKMTSCNPTFIDMRDAVMAANLALYGTEDKALLWEVFARRGLGYSAVAGGNAAFDTPTLLVEKNVSVTTADIGDEITYTIQVTNNSETDLNSISISDEIPDRINVTSISNGGVEFNGDVVFPTIAVLPQGNSVVRTFSGTITTGSATIVEYNNPIEEVAPPDFLPLSLWLTDGGNPNPNTSSTTSWWHLDPPTIADAYLVLSDTLDGTKNNHLSFWHYYDLEPTFDGGVVEIFDNGEWVDLGPRIIHNNYNRVVYDALPTPIGVPLPLNPISGRRSFTGYSNGYVNTIINLNGFDGAYMIRFRLGANASNNTNLCDGTVAGCDGWYIDDVQILDLVHVLNTACATSSQGIDACGDVGQLGTIIFSDVVLPVEWLQFEVNVKGDTAQLDWMVASQLNNSGFEIQRRRDQTNWEFIDWVEATNENNYRYADHLNKPTGTYYYRLKQVDFDGANSFSPVRAVTFAEVVRPLELFPNPANQYVTLRWSEPPGVAAVLEVLSSEGRLIYKKGLSTEQLTQKIDTYNWPSGIYIFRVQYANEIINKRILVHP